MPDGMNKNKTMVVKKTQNNMYIYVLCFLGEKYLTTVTYDNVRDMTIFENENNHLTFEHKTFNNFEECMEYHMEQGYWQKETVI